MFSVMLQSKGFGKLFLYSISHKNSLVSVDKFKSKNLDSLKHLIRVSTVEKLMGTSSEEEEIWNNYKVVYKNVCKSINELKKYCSKMEKQTEDDKLKKSIEAYYEKKEQFKEQIKFFANMESANADYINPKVEKSIISATNEFNKIRKNKKFKDLLKKSKCKETVISYESFKPAEKGKDDGGAPNAPHLGEFLKIQEENRNKENKNIEDHIEELIKEEKEREILNCQGEIANAAGNLANLVGIDVNAIKKVLKDNGWKDDSEGTIFNCLLTSLAAKVNNIKPSFSTSKEFKDLLSDKLKGTSQITKGNFNNIAINRAQLECIEKFRELWNKFIKETAKLDSVGKDEDIRKRKTITKEVNLWKGFIGEYDKYIKNIIQIKESCKLKQNANLKIYGQDERIAKNKKGDFENVKALQPFLKENIELRDLLAEFNQISSEINAEVVKFRNNYNSASKFVDEIKKKIGKYVYDYNDKFNDKGKTKMENIVSNSQGELNLNGWVPKNENLCLAQCVVTVYYYIDKYKDNRFNLFSTNEKYLDDYIEEESKLKLGSIFGKKK